MHLSFIRFIKSPLELHPRSLTNESQNMEIVYIVSILSVSLVGIIAMRLGFIPRIAAKTRYGDSIVIEASLPNNQTDTRKGATTVPDTFCSPNGHL